MATPTERRPGHPMTHDEQLAWLQLQADCGCPVDPCEHTNAPAPDAITAAAMRIVDEHGWYYDPPLTPKTVLRLVELVGTDPTPWLTVDDNGQAVRMEPAWWAAAAPNLYRAVRVDGSEG